MEKLIVQMTTDEYNGSIENLEASVSSAKNNIKQHYLDLIVC